MRDAGARAPPSSLAMRERDQLTYAMVVTESPIVTLVRLLHQAKACCESHIGRRGGVAQLIEAGARAPPSWVAMRERGLLTLSMVVTESGIVTLGRLVHL